MTEYEQNDVQDVDRPGLSQEFEIKGYEVPTIVSLGTLAELTHSGSTTPKNDAVHTGHSA